MGIVISCLMKFVTEVKIEFNFFIEKCKRFDLSIYLKIEDYFQIYIYRNMETSHSPTFVVILTFIFMLLIILLSVLIFQMAWNLTLPVLFKIPEIDFTQAFLLQVLLGYVFPSCPIYQSLLTCSECLKTPK